MLHDNNEVEQAGQHMNLDVGVQATPPSSGSVVSARTRDIQRKLPLVDVESPRDRQSVAKGSSYPIPRPPNTMDINTDPNYWSK